jgi:hypothetical protein
VARVIFGRPDGLEIFREITVEEGMMAVLLRGIRIESGGKGATVWTRGAAERVRLSRAHGARPLAVSHRWYGATKGPVARLVAAGLATLGIHLARRERSGDAEGMMDSTRLDQRTSVDFTDGKPR